MRLHVGVETAYMNNGYWQTLYISSINQIKWVKVSASWLVLDKLHASLHSVKHVVDSGKSSDFDTVQS